jgi:hypothetical protein
LALFAGASGAPAQQAAPLALDPSVARQGTTLLVTAGESALSPNGQPARSITFALARGMKIDTASRDRLCGRREATRGACPESSRIGFGRFGLDVRGYESGTGETELGWSIAAYLGEPQHRGDAASVVLIGRLLGADLVGSLLAPALGTSVPSTTTTVGRLIRRASGRYGVEVQFAKLPVQLDVAAPATATPSRLELALSAVRRVRQDFTRRIKIKTPSGYEVRKVADHRLIGHYLLRTPLTCNGSWPVEMRVGLPGGMKRTSSRIACTKAASGLPAAARRR